MTKSKIKLGLSVVATVTVAFGFARVAHGWSEPKILNEQENSVPADTEEDEKDDVAEKVKDESVVNQTETAVEAAPKIEIKERRPWQAPNFSAQDGALGWSATAFDVPKKLEARVNFWKDVYTRYTTDQGLLHDSQLVSVIYEKVDFKRETSRRERKHFLEARKKDIRERLLKLDKFDTEFQKTQVIPKLEGEDLRIWTLFNEITEPHRFKKATERKRLRFQLGQRDRFIQGIYYSGRYLPEMERVFKEAGMPRELTRLPFVESSFNVKARSRVGASGVWQFMRYTGRKFLRIHYAVDERNDPIRATEAAARLFRLNFEMLSKWSLAITGYNHGPVGVQRMIRKFETDDITDLVDERRGRFGFASANFFSCFLAALEVEKQATKYFGPVYWDAPMDAREIKLTRSVSHKVLEKWFGGDVEKAKELNPHLARVFWLGYAQLGAKDFVRVPTPQFEIAKKDLENLPAATKAVASVSSSVGAANTGLAAGTVVAAGGDGEASVQYYVIAPGETLGQIARELGVSIVALTEMNGIDNPRALHPGQKLMVPPSKK